MVRKPSSVVLFLLIVAIFVILLAPKVMQVFKLRERSGVLDIELKKLRAQNRLLEKELRLLKDDPVYLEKVARQELNKAKQGEIVYQLVREKSSVSGKEPVVR